RATLQAVAPPIATDLVRPLWFEGPWHVHAGDDVAWASPTHDRTDWALVEHTSFPTPWDDNPPLKGTSSAWFEAPLHIAPRDGQSPALLVHAAGAWEAYVDGRSVGGKGAIGRAVGMSGPRVVPLPSDVISDGAIDVAIRIWAPRTVDGRGGALFSIGVG